MYVCVLCFSKNNLRKCREDDVPIQNPARYRSKYFCRGWSWISHGIRHASSNKIKGSGHDIVPFGLKYGVSKIMIYFCLEERALLSIRNIFFPFSLPETQPLMKGRMLCMCTRTYTWFSFLHFFFTKKVPISTSYCSWFLKWCWGGRNPFKNRARSLFFSCFFLWWWCVLSFFFACGGDD